MQEKIDKFWDIWINQSHAYAYSTENKDASISLAKDIIEKPGTYWFNSKDLDQFMKKFIKQILTTK